MWEKDQGASCDSGTCLTGAGTMIRGIGLGCKLHKFKGTGQCSLVIWHMLYRLMLTKAQVTEAQVGLKRHMLGKHKLEEGTCLEGAY